MATKTKARATEARSLPSQAGDLEFKLRGLPDGKDTFYLYRRMLIRQRAMARFERRYGHPLDQESYRVWEMTRHVRTTIVPSRVQLADELQSGRAARDYLGQEPLADDRALLIWWLVRIGSDLGLILRDSFAGEIADLGRAPWAPKGGNSTTVRRGR